MIPRNLQETVKQFAAQMPALTLLGPRQSGKTTFCKMLFPDKPYCSLEDFETRRFAQTDPKSFLGQFPDGAILDEIQRAPELTSYLQGIIDADPRPSQWVLTGSQNFSVIEGVSQSLAGRTAVLNLLPFERGELEQASIAPSTLLESVRVGGYPRIYDQGLDPESWHQSYLETYLSRDVQTLLGIRDKDAFRMFMKLCAGRVGQLLNYSSLASDCGVDKKTIQSWITVLEASFLCFRLPPYFANVRKRLVKMPKLYFYDTGLACTLLGIHNDEQLLTHPSRGSLIENWVVSEKVKMNVHSGRHHQLYFYRDSQGLEADLLIETGGAIQLVEVKSSATIVGQPFATLERVKAIIETEQRPCKLSVVYGGDQAQTRSKGDILPWSDLQI